MLALLKRCEQFNAVVLYSFSKDSDRFIMEVTCKRKKKYYQDNMIFINRELTQAFIRAI